MEDNFKTTEAQRRASKRYREKLIANPEMKAMERIKNYYRHAKIYAKESDNPEELKELQNLIIARLKELDK